MVAPRARVFRPLVKGNEALGTRLVALIQCATMAIEVVEVAAESEEDVVINCVAIFYEEGREGENFRKKNKFRCYSGTPCTCGFGVWEKIRMQFAVFWRISVRFCGSQIPLTSPSYILHVWPQGFGLSLLLVLIPAPRVLLRVLQFSSLHKNQHF